jgi:putative endonuclease
VYQRHILGKRGEDEAVRYLESKDYQIIERNFECRQGEIDVIALDEDYIVFIEIFVFIEFVT